MVTQLNQNLAQKSITVTVTDDAKKWILEQDPRPTAATVHVRCAAHCRSTSKTRSRKRSIQGTITTRPAFIEVFLDGDKLFYRPVDSQETAGVLLYENS